VRSSRDRTRDRIFGLYLVVCLGAVTWPLYAKLGDSIEPYVFGLPFSLAWVVGWVGLTFVALVVYHGTGRDERS
jgi:hypothetical protein